MINYLKPYPAYKPSGVEWLGEVPAHWEVRRLKTAVAHINEQMNAKNPDDLYIALEHVESWTGRLRVPSGDIQFDSQVKRFRAGDVLFGKLRPYLAKVVRPKQSGVCVGEFFVLRARPVFAPHYLEVVLRSAPAIDFVNSSTYGAKMPRADWTFVGAMLFPLPPLPEQTAIVRFLDWAEQRIRRVIRARQRRFKLLEEYKQALIHQAVTGRIDVRTGRPYPAYKDSGVDWLGEVPEHWEVRRLKHIARLNPTKSEVGSLLKDGIAVFLPMERVGVDGRIDCSEVRPLVELWNGFTYFRRGDVIVAKITPCFENGKGACLTALPTEIGFGSTEFYVLRPRPGIHADFLYRITTLPEFRHLGAEAMIGAAGQQRVPSSFVEQFQSAFPPLPEQTAIVEYLDAQATKINAAIAAARREIDLLREYRERLIADVVTGKLDVREVAEKLPDEPEEELELIEDEAEEKDVDEIDTLPEEDSDE
ncbi:restriction endonuclease subunit S [hot springs metagenome]|uniref:Restriction endonuclease subunit S n=1 Tax=hot springs metagenome TaxID=433727 RepID=A0A5J4L2M9_9ZZZZ